jgi:hypothetical protein
MLSKKDNFVGNSGKMNEILLNFSTNCLYISHFNIISDLKFTLFSSEYSTSLGPNQIQHMPHSTLVNLS